MAVWLVRGGKGGVHEQRMLDNDFVSIGWIDLPDLSNIKDKEELKKIYMQIYSDAKKNRMINHASQIWRFINKIKENDLIITPLKTQSAIAIAKVKGSYEYVDSFGTDLHHIRKVEWLTKDLSRTAFDQDLLYSFGAFMTVCQVKRNNAEKRIKAVLEGKTISVSPQEEEGIVEDESLDIEQIARDQVMKQLEYKFKGHVLAELVDELLQAQGYITKRSEPGPDGGVDILAGSGPMGFEEPKLCVQVKSGSSAADVNTLRSLIGTMKNFEASQGLLVSWSGFTRKVAEEARQKFFTARLWDSGEIVNMISKYYDKLSDSMQAILPLKRIWILANEEEIE